METQTRLDYLTNTFNIDPGILERLHQHRVVVIVPAYNEERFIGSVILKILRFPVAVIVVDDGSTDATAFVAEAAGALVVRHDYNLGKGVALNTGIVEARPMDPEAIVFIDGDGQHLVREFPHLVMPILDGQADIVVGSRYLQKTSHTPSQRRLAHWFFNKLTFFTSQVSVTDSQSGYRAFSPQAFNTDLFLSTDFSVESEMQFFAHEHALRLIEVPITIRYTDPPKRSAYAQGMSVLAGLIKLTGQYRPLLFFGLPGILLMLLAFLMGVVVVERFRLSSQLAVGYAMISVLLTIIGMVSLSSGVILHSIRGLLSDMLRKNGHHR
jgi:glycosyltransferase involved in cell wall biosynthesis